MMAISMKVILKKEVAGLGHAGEIKEVATGYARNFLMLRGLAELATPDKIEQLKIQQERKQKEFEAIHKQWEGIIQQLPEITLSFKRKTSKLGKLFAGVGVDQIALALALETKSKIDPAAISLIKPIKSVGDHSAKVMFSPELQGEVKITVLSE